jgi:hypothetical protein
MTEAWQPIETAPKDGSEFQAWAGSYDGGWWEPKARINPESERVELWQRVDYDQDGWEAENGDDWNVTHWMPLPTPPTGEQQ